MFTDFLLERFVENREKPGIVWKDQVFSYGVLLEKIKESQAFLKRTDLKRNSIVAIEADFSPNSTALLIALIEHGCVIVPLSSAVGSQRGVYLELAQVETIYKSVSGNDHFEVELTGNTVSHPILIELKETKKPGLVLFSSGSTGVSKAIVHGFEPLLEKFKVKRKSKRMLSFLLFDHIGGINTLFAALSNAACLVTVTDRSPDRVADAIAKYGVQILPTSPTFISLILLSEAFNRYDISKLELVTYGTEVMPPSTLARFHAQFPQIQLLQTYGLSEIGILRSKSLSSDSLWVKVGGEGFETRVKEGMLEIKAQSAMIGYLNAPSPFTEDGWFKTGDVVEAEGEYFKILGRKSEIINVGGEKVFPTEIESVLQSMEGVEDAVVKGELNLITGNLVSARITLSTEESVVDFRKRMRSFCQGKLATYKIPQKVTLSNERSHSERFKKMRNNA